VSIGRATLFAVIGWLSLCGCGSPEGSGAEQRCRVTGTFHLPAGFELREDHVLTVIVSRSGVPLSKRDTLVDRPARRFRIEVPGVDPVDIQLTGVEPLRPVPMAPAWPEESHTSRRVVHSLRGHVFEQQGVACGEHVELRLGAIETAQLPVRVESPEGNAVAGAWVTLERMADEIVARTDPEGRVTLDGVRLGTWRLTARLPAEERMRRGWACGRRTVRANDLGREVRVAFRDARTVSIRAWPDVPAEAFFLIRGPDPGAPMDLLPWLPDVDGTCAVPLDPDWPSAKIELHAPSPDDPSKTIVIGTAAVPKESAGGPVTLTRR
jgi:hypothetical protein